MKPEFSLGKYRPDFEQALGEAASKSYVKRIWARDPALWKDEDAHQKIIRKSLGWLTVAEEMKENLREIQRFSDSVRGEGFTTVCLLGMGGSSLCPEVAASTFGTREGFLKLVVLDTTVPASLLAAEKGLDLARTLFLVSSKSGGTIESASLQKYFFEKVRASKGSNAGASFAAITDPGTPLEKLGHDQGFRRVFLNQPDIGGRYSALSYFGLVPMALIGVDVASLLDRATNMAAECRQEDPQSNPGLQVGVALGMLALHGVDKATFVLGPEFEAFGYWVEQLIAESTGKDGNGVVPIEGEVLGVPAVYQQDRVFIHLDLAGKPEPFVHAQLHALEQAGHPVLRWELRDKLDLGCEFFLWEFATAAAGAVMRINPFDQPNVKESKDNTQRLIEHFYATGKIDERAPVTQEKLLSLWCDPIETLSPGGQAGLLSSLRDFLRLARPRDYIALLAYVERSPATSAAMRVIRGVLRDNLRRATTLGYGPRFLHSTGQLHKGGANNGIFIQLTAADPRDVAVPGERYTFDTLKRAQSSGDFEALVKHGRRAVRLHIDGDVAEGLDRLGSILEKASSS
jgi:glucose-6-phosphate isomerase